ncbi:hypothetical protein SPRG_04507 [Saprolegnia parasitica CBS 223.65]|uniref:Uncharacterized protein n=1 Tax=Saprolegnia parasitica (strain CBS 223.65) TaxID=695850 RepID=A0A067CJB6_SAPPC|nr:hypothetical protein SPRG_04507 [Saprolegnia parasitica CBS 223.65]KDO30608.1 hypothetical protein SPRG_04507 [Saprolegnia parasitica CBS 223.65]|eukprot:XP_012198819.1 hypothetical protein SPRG_04507 [Saprolegnia parasitica CBS 223.65]
MLSLNTYGLARPSLNQASSVHLPRLQASPHQSNAAASVGKLAQQRRNIHPLFQTSGFDYGRVVDYQDLGLHLSPAKRPLAKHMDFTSTFIEGPFTDSSLGSLDMKKKRLVLSDRLQAERKVRTKDKYDEKQLQLSFKREIRRELREKRRLEMLEQAAAATTIQRYARGMLTRNRLWRQHLALQNAAATRIQLFCRSQMQIYDAKCQLQRIKQRRWDDAAAVIQRRVRLFLQRQAAKRELARRRKAREERRQEMLQRANRVRAAAATLIQKVIRGVLVPHAVGKVVLWYVD